MTTADIRRPVSCGAHAFYPADPKELRRTLGEMFSRCKEQLASDAVAIVVPHAGYVYSGPTAARAYHMLEGRHYDRVIVLAPSHYAAFPGASIFNGLAFGTPLGDIPLDTEFIRQLRYDYPLFHYFPEVEAREHSLEVQLPFLQSVLGAEFVLVPVMLYDRRHSNCVAVAEAIGKMLDRDDKRTLIVASSDLYHGPGADKAKKKSEQVAAALTKMDAAEFCAGVEHGDLQACGAGAVATAMILGRLRGANQAKVLDVTTSFEVYPVNEDYVVGYLSAVFHRA